MKQRLVRCCRGYASLPGMANIEVFYVQPDMYLLKLVTCIVCGEIFVIDLENPKLACKEFKEIAGNSSCPNCSHMLSETLRAYPETFRAEDGRIGTFSPSRIIIPDSESIIKSLYEIGAG